MKSWVTTFHVQLKRTYIPIFVSEFLGRNHYQSFFSLLSFDNSKHHDSFSLILWSQSSKSHYYICTARVKLCLKFKKLYCFWVEFLGRSDLMKFQISKVGSWEWAMKMNDERFLLSLLQSFFLIDPQSDLPNVFAFSLLLALLVRVGGWSDVARASLGLVCLVKVCMSMWSAISESVLSNGTNGLLISELSRWADWLRSGDWSSEELSWMPCSMQRGQRCFDWSNKNPSLSTPRTRQSFPSPMTLWWPQRYSVRTPRLSSRSSGAVSKGLAGRERMTGFLGGTLFRQSGHSLLCLIQVVSGPVMHLHSLAFSASVKVRLAKYWCSQEKLVTAPTSQSMTEFGFGFGVVVGLENEDCFTIKKSW